MSSDPFIARGRFYAAGKQERSAPTTRRVRACIQTSPLLSLAGLKPHVLVTDQMADLRSCVRLWQEPHTVPFVSRAGIWRALPSETSRRYMPQDGVFIIAVVGTSDPVKL
jgi:hypothetical protein